jgi:hypothetical protein
LSKLRTKGLVTGLATAVASWIALNDGLGAAENFRKLSGAQIRARLSGKEITDEVHWREVYERNGTVRSYAMGKKWIGKWTVQGDDLCLDLPEPEGGCFEVTASGNHMVMTPTGLGSPADGVLQDISDPK